MRKPEELDTQGNAGTPGYHLIVIREDTFGHLKRFWREGDDRNENALARLATAFIELGLATGAHCSDARIAAKQLHLIDHVNHLRKIGKLPADAIPNEVAVS